MKNMDSFGLKMCKYQADLFETSLKYMDCSSKIFIRRFMNSELAVRMDNEGFIFDATDISDALIEVESQYGRSTYGKEKFTSEELYWIGYIYRYWSYISGESSKNLYKKINPEYLKKLYFPYHSLYPLQAIERISEEKGYIIENKYDDISRGVIILRRIRNKYKATGEKLG